MTTLQIPVPLLKSERLLPDVLLSHGAFEAAEKASQREISEGSRSATDHMVYAALLAHRGEVSAARKVLQSFYQKHPLGTPPAQLPPESERLLYVRGLDQTRPFIGKGSNGKYKAMLRGGHYTLAYLLPKAELTRQRLTLTPDSDPRQLRPPPHPVLLNTISDPDIEGGSLAALSAYLSTHPDERVINHPDHVVQTSRDGNYQRLSDLEDVIFPRTCRIDMSVASVDQRRKALKELGFQPPFILRETGTQTGRTTVLVESWKALNAPSVMALTGPCYAIAFHQHLWRGEFYRKMRLFVIDGRPYPVVCHFDRHWNVHGANRLHIMKKSEALMALEMRFLRDWQGYVGKRAQAALERVIAVTPLQFFGIDFTVTEQGKLFIYELNASMRHSYDHARHFVYKRGYDEATSDAFQKMVRKYMNRPRRLARL